MNTEQRRREWTCMKRRLGRALSNLCALEYWTLAKPMPDELPERPVELADLAAIFDLPKPTAGRIKRWIRLDWIGAEQGVIRVGGRWLLDLRTMARCFPKDVQFRCTCCQSVGHAQILPDEIDEWCANHHVVPVALLGWDRRELNA